MTPDETKTKLLDAAQALVQKRGHNGYSYRDLSQSIGITTAGVHYHYPSKDDLGVALIQRYGEVIDSHMAQIAAKFPTLRQRLEAVGSIFTQILKQDRQICLCAALSGEFQSLPVPMQKEVERMIDLTEGWIYRFLAEGKAKGELPASSDPKALAVLWFSALEGAILIARASQPNRLALTIKTLLHLTLP